MSRCIVVVPTYNEAENLPLLVPAVLAQDERLEVLDRRRRLAGRNRQVRRRPRAREPARPRAAPPAEAGARSGLSRGHRARARARRRLRGADGCGLLPSARDAREDARGDRAPRRRERLALPRRHHRGELADRADPDQLFRQRLRAARDRAPDHRHDGRLPLHAPRAARADRDRARARERLRVPDRAQLPLRARGRAREGDPVLLLRPPARHLEAQLADRLRGDLDRAAAARRGRAAAC